MPYTLERATLGRLAAYALSPIAGVEDTFDAGDFETPPNCSLGVDAGGFFIRSLSNNIFQRVSSHLATGDRADVFIVVRTGTITGAAQAGAGARADSVAYPGNTAILGDVPINGAFATRVIEVVAGSQLQSDSDAANLSGSQRVSLWVKGTNAKTYAFGPGFENSLGGLTLAAAGGVGPTYNRGTQGHVHYSGVWIMSDAIFTVNGPSGTWRVDILDGSGTVLATAASVAGVAEVDLFAARIAFPAAVKVEIRDTGTEELLVDATPTERIWGGDVWTLTPPVVIPDVPTGLAVANPTTSTLDVSWDTPTGATSFQLDRAPSALGPWTQVYEGAVASFGDTGLDDDTTYFYRVRACNEAGCSASSAAASGTTEEIVPPDYIPCTLILEVYEADGVTVAWEVATDPAHATPYLRHTTHYGAREIDPVSGAATLGTIDVQVVDVPTIEGDQTSGFVTSKLPDIFGRRCRLRRFVSSALGYFTIADGPAGPPRMAPSYAAYSWSIRDTRETERRLRPFSGGGTTGLVPFGPISQWGEKSDGSFLLSGVTPVVGKMFVHNLGGEWLGQVLFGDLVDSTSVPGTTFVPESLVVGEDAEAALAGVVLGERGIYPNADILWRLSGSGGAWNVSRPSSPALLTTDIAGLIDGEIEATGEEVRALNSLILYWASDIPAGMPATNDIEVEIIVRHRGNPTEELPHYYEGTLGDLLARLYDRDLERAPDLGGDLYDPEGLDAIPATTFGGGVRYDEAVLAAMDTPVLLRQTDAVDDGRSWAEQELYAPSGWIPSIDTDGKISPVSRERPSTITGPTITDAIAEPAPNWDAGERVVTAVEYTSRRYFIPTNPTVETEVDGLAIREVVTIFRDAEAEERHGEQTVEYSALAFGAVGTGAGAAQSGVPETAVTLAGAARYEVLERYRDGAPAIRVRVRRADVPTIRDGMYCAVTLAWAPDIDTRLRGASIAAAQVLSVENADCGWVTLLLERTPVVAVPGYYSNGTKTGDEPQPGYYDNPELISDDIGEGS